MQAGQEERCQLSYLAMKPVSPDDYHGKMHTCAIAVCMLLGNPMFSDWISGLLHRWKHTSSTINLANSPRLESL